MMGSCLQEKVDIQIFYVIFILRKFGIYLFYVIYRMFIVVVKGVILVSLYLKYLLEEEEIYGGIFFFKEDS